jgi:hypothetical protein
LNQDNLRECKPIGEALKPTFRGILKDYHVAAISILVLLLWSIDSGGKALVSLLVLASGFSDSVVTVGAMWWHGGIVSFGSPDVFFDRSLFVMTLNDLFWTVTSFGAAWIVSRCVYGVGPFRTLSAYRARVARRDYV